MPQRLDLPLPRRRTAAALRFDPGSLRFATDALPWQRSLRWREPPRSWRLFALGIVLAVLVTVLELTGFVLGMRPYRTPAPDTRVIQVALIEPEVEPPPPPEPEPPPKPEPEPPPFKARPSRIPIAPPQVRMTPPPPRPVESSDAMSGRIGGAGAVESAPRLFNPDGSVRLGGSAVKIPEAPRTERARAAARWTQIEQAGRNPLDCHRTQYTGKFAPDETVGSGIARKYLSWAGLYDPHDTQQRAQRAADGCDPDPAQ